MQKKVKVRRPYDASVRQSVSFPEQTMAKQSFKDECDINTIMSRYQSTGIIEHVQAVQGSYGDFTSVQDYQLSLNQVIAAQEAFERLPAKIRERFANDPSHLMAFLQDDNNTEEAVRLGLIPQPPAAPPAPPSPAPTEKPGQASTNDQQPQAAPPNKGP